MRTWVLLPLLLALTCSVARAAEADWSSQSIESVTKGCMKSSSGTPQFCKCSAKEIAQKTTPGSYAKMPAADRDKLIMKAGFACLEYHGR